jgi:hypothetical protein
MGQRTPTAVVAVLILSVWAAATRANADPAKPDHAAALDSQSPQITQICMLDLFGLAKVEIVRPGVPVIDLDIEIGDGCGLDATLVRDFNGRQYGPWMLEIREAPKEGASDSNDVVYEPSCPTLTPHMSGLHPWPQPKSDAEVRLRRGINPETMAGTKVGEFVFKDWSGLFRLQTKEQRAAAAQWVRQTLADVRPCWDNFRQDSEQSPIIDHLYAEIAERR